MPDELQPLPSLEAAIAALNAEIERRRQAEVRANDLAAEVAVLKTMLCQCKQDRDFPDL